MFLEKSSQKNLEKVRQNPNCNVWWDTHCYFTRLNVRKMGPLLFYFPVFLGINLHLKQKWFLNSCKGSLRAALTEHSSPSPFWEIAKMHFLTPEWNFDFFGPNAFIWSAMKVPFRDFIQNMSQALSKRLSKWIKVNN